jgi:hypothetical protein
VTRFWLAARQAMTWLTKAVDHQCARLVVGGTRVVPRGTRLVWNSQIRGNFFPPLYSAPPRAIAYVPVQTPIKFIRAHGSPCQFIRPANSGFQTHDLVFFAKDRSKSRHVSPILSIMYKYIERIVFAQFCCYHHVRLKFYIISMLRNLGFQVLITQDHWTERSPSKPSKQQQQQQAANYS